MMERTYVEQRDGGYWMRSTRISLDSIVYAFKRSAAPESIQRAFPLLTLEEIYGAITFIWRTRRKLTRIWRKPKRSLPFRPVP
jgi:uncharacterized protein (DUF433 family)